MKNCLNLKLNDGIENKKTGKGMVTAFCLKIARLL